MIYHLSKKDSEYELVISKNGIYSTFGVEKCENVSFDIETSGSDQDGDSVYDLFHSGKIRNFKCSKINGPGLNDFQLQITTDGEAQETVRVLNETFRDQDFSVYQEFGFSLEAENFAELISEFKNILKIKKRLLILSQNKVL